MDKKTAIFALGALALLVVLAALAFTLSKSGYIAVGTDLERNDVLSVNYARAEQPLEFSIITPQYGAAINAIPTTADGLLDVWATTDTGGGCPHTSDFKFVSLTAVSLDSVRVYIDGQQVPFDKAAAAKSTIFCGQYPPGDDPNALKDACLILNISKSYSLSDFTIPSGGVYVEPMQPQIRPSQIFVVPDYTIIPPRIALANFQVPQNLSLGKHRLDVYWLGTPGVLSAYGACSSQIRSPYGGPNYWGYPRYSIKAGADFEVLSPSQPAPVQPPTEERGILLVPGSNATISPQQTAVIIPLNNTTIFTSPLPQIPNTPQDSSFDLAKSWPLVCGLPVLIVIIIALFLIFKRRG